MSKGKWAVVVVVAGAVLAGAVAYAATDSGRGSAKSGGCVGRFQIASGDYSVLCGGDAGGAVDTYHGVFLVDTATGRIWERVETQRTSGGVTTGKLMWLLVAVEGVETGAPISTTTSAGNTATQRSKGNGR